jgi:hypothetical protein
MKPDYRLGRVVTAYLLGRNGKREEHPAVIISPDSEIIQPEDFDPRSSRGIVSANLVGALGISTKYGNFSDPFIALPPGTTTELTRDCAVILNWYAVLDIPGDCEFLLGDVPPQLIQQINAAYIPRIVLGPWACVVTGIGLFHPRANTPPKNSGFSLRFAYAMAVGFGLLRMESPISSSTRRFLFEWEAASATIDHLTSFPAMRSGNCRNKNARNVGRALPAEIAGWPRFFRKSFTPHHYQTADFPTSVPPGEYPTEPLDP